MGATAAVEDLIDHSALGMPPVLDAVPRVPHDVPAKVGVVLLACGLQSHIREIPHDFLIHGENVAVGDCASVFVLPALFPAVLDGIVLENRVAVFSTRTFPVKNMFLPINLEIVMFRKLFSREPVHVGVTDQDDGVAVGVIRRSGEVLDLPEQLHRLGITRRTEVDVVDVDHEPGGDLDLHQHEPLTGQALPSLEDKPLSDVPGVPVRPLGDVVEHVKGLSIHVVAEVVGVPRRSLVVVYIAEVIFVANFVSRTALPKRPLGCAGMPPERERGIEVDPVVLRPGQQVKDVPGHTLAELLSFCQLPSIAGQRHPSGLKIFA